MDGMRDPVGDESRGVYWRRRLTVLGGVVLVVLILWFLISATLADGDDSPGASPDPTTTPDAEQTPDANGVFACTENDVDITVNVPSAGYGGGTMPTFEVQIDHVGSTACRLTTDDAETTMAIRSGNEAYYSTASCPNDTVFPSTSWVLQEGNSETVQATWTGQRVDGECGVIESRAGAGFYWVAIAIGGVSADEVQFQITG